MSEEFGAQGMVILRNGEEPRLARGVKSRLFHFSVPMCAPCNNERTQPSDKEWDRFRLLAKQLIAAKREPVEAFDDPRYQPTGSTLSPAYLNVLRYLAKMLSGHMAESAVPRSERLSRFTLGLNDDCPITVSIIRDRTYEDHARRHGDHAYAAHGGLVLLGNADTGYPTGFHSSLTVGMLQCTITYRLNAAEQLDLLESHPEFSARCRTLTLSGEVAPIPDDSMVKLGLA